MPGPFPVRRPRPARPGTRRLVRAVIRATADAAVSRSPGRSTDPPARWSPYRLPGTAARRVVGRLDRLLVERAGGLRARQWRSRTVRDR